MKSTVKIILIALLVLTWVIPASALNFTNYSSNATRAVNWLASTQNSDGSWCEGESKYPCTTESVLALQSLNKRNTAYYWGVAWLENNSPANSDFMARRILALFPHGDNVSAELSALQSAQAQAITQLGKSGWGLSAAYQGSPLDSALVLLAYAQPGVNPNPAPDISAALDYLKATQLTTNNETGWAEATSNPTTTALVVLALVANNNTYGSLTTYIANGIAALSAKVDSTSPVYLRALAALAYLKAGGAYTSDGTATLDELALLQATNGSWGTDTYATALTVRALAAAMGTGVSTLADRVSIPDPNLRAAINNALGKNAMDSINKGELQSLTTLDAQGKGITNLTGLEWATNLTSVNLRGNNIGSFTPLTGLTKLTTIDIDVALSVDSFNANTNGSGMTFTGT